MNEFIRTLEDALSTLLVKMDLFIPYENDDGAISTVHTQGAVDSIEYRNTGTFLRCRVSRTLAPRLERFRVEAGKLYT